MKAGKSLTELALEIDRQSAAKKDYGVDTRRLVMEPAGDEKAMTLTIDGGAQIAPLSVNSIAHRQIGAWAGIPAAYYDRMLSERPELLANNVNAWFRDNPSQKSLERALRTLDGTARAFLSRKYRPIDNDVVAGAALQIVHDEMPGAQAESCEITEQRMYMKIVNPRLQAEVVPGDIVQAGVIISNSEVGMGSVNVSPLLYRLVCSNGMVANDFAAKKYHVGRHVEFGENFEMYTDATIEADNRAFMLKIQDTVRGAIVEAKFRRIVERMREAVGAKIDTQADIPAVVDLTAKQYGITQGEGKGILNHLIQGGDLSLYGLANAVTRAAQDVESYDRSTDLESTGYSILTMNPALWRRINSEAGRG